MATSVIQPSFAAGELSPTLYGRVDLAKFKTGVALSRNAFVDYRGGLSNRSGLRYVGQAKGNEDVRLVPFRFSTVQNYVLEFGPLYIRVIKDGAYVTQGAQAITGITNANPGVVTLAAHGYSTGDWVYLSINGMPNLNTRTFAINVLTVNTFTLVDTITGAAIDTTSMGAFINGSAARIYTVTTTYAAADIARLKFTQSADVLTITHPSYPAADLTRTSHTNWTLTEISFASQIVPPNTVNGVSSGAGTTYYAYVITAVSGGGEESLPSDAARFQGVNISATAGTNKIAWSRVSAAAYYNVYRAQAGTTYDVPVGSAYGFVGVAYGLEFNDSNITPDYSKTPPQNNNPFAKGPITLGTITAIGAGYVNPLTTIATVSDATGTGAVIVPIVVSGSVYGLYIVNGGENYTAPTVNITGGGGAGATATLSIGPVTGTYPSVATYYQQRKVFAASDNYPQTLWGTKPGAFKNMDRGIPVNDGDSYALTLASQQVNDIKSMLSMPGGLVALTGAGAWQISGNGQNNSPITPTSAQATPQSYVGASDLPPLVINYDILYTRANGSGVQDMSYNFFANIYTGTDLGLLSNHLFYGKSIVEWGYAEDPFKLVWAVRSDGRILSLTFVKEQEVYGWTQHSTQGQAKSVCVIREDATDVPYFIVKRKVQGVWVQFVEQMQTRIVGLDVNPAISSEDGWFLDAALDLGMAEPAAELVLSGASGTVIASADAAVFGASDVGKILRAGGGKGIVRTYVDPQNVSVEWIASPVQLIPDDPDLVPLPCPAGTWTLTRPVTTVSGLWHLEGKTVKVIADGNVQPPKTVTNGAISISQPASRIIVGLSYVTQIQTLNIDVNSAETIQGRRKRITAVTLRCDKSRAPFVGPDFENMTEWKQPRTVPMGQALPLFTNDMLINIPPAWNNEGRVCIEMREPLPFTLLAAIPEILIGDKL